MQEKKKLIDQMTGENVSISYTGPFDGQVLSVIAKNIEYSLSVNPQVNKKMFKIFLELAQNIAYYSEEKNINNRGESAGIGTLAIQEFNQYFVFATGNMVQLDVAKHVIDKCDKINSLERKELREFKRQQRKLPPGEKGGGNIGLIQVALTAENRLNYKVIPVDDNKYFFIIGVRINKN